MTQSGFVLYSGFNESEAYDTILKLERLGVITYPFNDILETCV